MPQHMAVVLTYPERVTRHNMDKLRQRVLNGGRRGGGGRKGGCMGRDVTIRRTCNIV